MQQSSLFTVAFPDLAADELHSLQLFREKRDPHYLVIGPHFTLVFGIGELSEAAYLDHVAEVARSSRHIGFHCRYAMVGADEAGDTAYVFLVPDEGNAAVSLLHDRLYRGSFTPFLKLEHPYIPHITIASTNDFGLAKALCDELNDRQVSIGGRLSALTVGAVRDGRFNSHGTYALGA